MIKQGEKTYEIAKWFINKNNLSDAQIADLTVTHETEKAVYAEGEFGGQWFPKAALVSIEEAAAAINQKREEGLNRYEQLLNAAREAGLKVRARSKVDTIVKIAKDAGKFEAIADLVVWEAAGWCKAHWELAK